MTSPPDAPAEDDCPGWTKIDENRATSTVHSAEANCTSVTPMASSTNTPVPDGVPVQDQEQSDRREWRILRNDQFAIADLPCNGDDLQLIDNNQATRRFFTSGPNLYRVTYNGLISTFTGQPCQGDDCSQSWKERPTEPFGGDVEVVRAGRNPVLNDTRVMYFILKVTGKLKSPSQSK